VICFKTSEGRFNLRSAAVIIQNDHILIHRAVSDEFWALPGGRVELFETSGEAVERELSEELGLDCKVVRLLWHTENFFEYNSEKFHELANYFLVSFIKEPNIESEIDFEGIDKLVDLIFRWVPLKKVGEYNLYPRFLTEGINSLPSSVQYVGINELNA
jgi:8-oxo-dGTP pyrophosphatase MutT (NUDIX family)